MLKQASPVLHVRDMRRALEFYQRSLGFNCIFKLDDEHRPEIPYAVVGRDEVRIHLQLSGPLAGHNSCYITVDSADALYEEFLKGGVTVTREIENSNYGMRDFNVVDLDGNTIGFGQPLETNQPDPAETG